MINVSNDFKEAMKQPVKELDAYIKVSDTEQIKSADDLISFKISCDTGMCKTAMRKLEAKYLGEHNLLGKWVYIGFGVRLASGNFEYLDYGSFLVTEITTIKDTGVTTITGYDQMIKAMVGYNKLDINYPIGLYDYTKKLCDTCGLTLGNENFVTHNDWQITNELWENINGITYRDILVQIAQATGSTCIITNDDKIYFKPIYETKETLTYDNMKKLKLEPIYGEINSVVLSRTPAEDNIYMRDEESVKTNGLTEFKIENNEIIDKNRDNAMTAIYEALHGISYYPFEVNTEGLGWYEIADNFDIINDTGDVFNTSLFNFSITINGGIKEILKTVADTKTQTQYQYATTIAKRILNTEIIVDKQAGEIKTAVELSEQANSQSTETKHNVETITNTVSDIKQQVDDATGDITTIEKAVNVLEENVNGLKNTLETQGGSNLLLNSSGLFENEHWEGTIKSITSTDIQNSFIAKACFNLQNGSMKQTINVVNGSYYIGFKYQKLLELANCKMLINGTEIGLTSTTLKEVDNIIEVSEHSITIELISDTNNACLIGDIIVVQGSKQSWSSNMNEIYTNTVKIGIGMEITSSTMKTRLLANADGVRIVNTTNNTVKTEFTDKGTKTDELEANTAKIAGILIQKNNNQTWISSLL